MQWPAIWLQGKGGARSDFGLELKKLYSPKFLIFEELSHDTMFAGFGWMVFCLLHQDFETPMAHNSTCIPPLHVILGCGSMHFDKLSHGVTPMSSKSVQHAKQRGGSSGKCPNLAFFGRFWLKGSLDPCRYTPSAVTASTCAHMNP